MRLVCALFILMMSLVDGNTKEFNNLLSPTKLGNEASAAVLAAMARAYDAFSIGETKGMEARQTQLQSAGIALAEASNLMLLTLEEMKANGLGLVAAKYADVDLTAQTAMAQWLDANKIPQPITVFDLYSVSTSSTRDFSERLIAWSKRDDDDVFQEFIRESSQFLQAGWAASRIFEASGG